MSDLEHGIALHTMQGNHDSFHGMREVSWVFLSGGGKLGHILELWQGWPFKTRVCSGTSGLLSSCEGQARNLLEVGQDNMDSSRCRVEDQGSLSSCQSDIGIPINF